MTSKRLVHKVLTASKPRQSHIFSAVIEKVHDYKECDVRKLTLRAAGCPYDPLAEFSYRAGQWVDFIIPGVDVVGGYSFVSAPTRNGQNVLSSDSPQHSLPSFDLAIKRSDHAPAAWVHSAACREESKVEVKVGGDFTLDLMKRVDVDTDTVCFIAGGVGINPLFAMTLELMQGSHRGINPKGDDTYLLKKSRSILLMWSVKSMSDAYLLPELIKLSSIDASSVSRHENEIKIVVTVTGEDSKISSSDNSILLEFSNTFQDIVGAHSQPQYLETDTMTSRSDGNQEEAVKPEVSCVTVERGRVSPALLQTHLSSLQRFSVQSAAAFVCGPPSFSDDVIDMLKTDCSLCSDRVFTESWW